MTKKEGKTSLKPVDSHIIPDFIKRACSDKPIFQVEINENLLPESSYKNESSYTDFKRLEEEDVEK